MSMLLRIHIIFSIAPAKMKMSLLLFVFAFFSYKVYKFEKENKFPYSSSSLKSEKVQGCEVLAMKVMLESLHSVLYKRVFSFF